jgi:hypothetical protein
MKLTEKPFWQSSIHAESGSSGQLTMRGNRSISKKKFDIDTCKLTERRAGLYLGFVWGKSDDADSSLGEKSDPLTGDVTRPN